MQAGIIGLGLIGGSLGLALRDTKIFKSIVGLDNNSLHLQQGLPSIERTKPRHDDSRQGCRCVDYKHRYWRP